MNNWEKFLVELNCIANEYNVNLDDVDISGEFISEDGAYSRGNINTGDYSTFNALKARSRNLQTKEWEILS